MRQIWLIPVLAVSLGNFADAQSMRASFEFEADAILPRNTIVGPDGSCTTEWNHRPRATVTIVIEIVEPEPGFPSASLVDFRADFESENLHILENNDSFCFGEAHVVLDECTWRNATPVTGGFYEDWVLGFANVVLGVTASGSMESNLVVYQLGEFEIAYDYVGSREYDGSVSWNLYKVGDEWFGNFILSHRNPPEPIFASGDGDFYFEAYSQDESSIAGNFVPARIWCSPVDFAEPFGVVDLQDLSAFIDAYLNQRNLANLAGIEQGVLDLADIAVFIDLFSAGCP